VPSAGESAERRRDGEITNCGDDRWCAVSFPSQRWARVRRLLEPARVFRQGGGELAYESLASLGHSSSSLHNFLTPAGARIPGGYEETAEETTNHSNQKYSCLSIFLLWAFSRQEYSGAGILGLSLKRERYESGELLYSFLYSCDSRLKDARVTRASWGPRL